jgi:hypothetical protein
MASNGGMSVAACVMVAPSLLRRPHFLQRRARKREIDTTRKKIDPHQLGSACAAGNPRNATEHHRRVRACQ